MYKAIHLMYTFFNESTKWYIFNLYKFSIFTFKIHIFQKMYNSQRMKKTYVYFTQKKKNYVYSIYTFFKECTQFYPYNIQNLINEQNSIHLMYTILYINMHNISMKLLNTQFIEECKQFSNSIYAFIFVFQKLHIVRQIFCR